MSWVLSGLVPAQAHAQGGLTGHNLTLVISTVIVVALIVLVAWLSRKDVGVIPRGWGAVFEHTFDWLDGMAQDMMGPQGRRFVPFAMSIFLFVLVSNWSGLLPIPVLGGTEAAAPVEAEAAPHGEAAGHEEAHAGSAPFEAPSASFNTTFALAVISFLAFNWFGIQKQVFPPRHAHAHGTGEHHHHGPRGGFAGFVDWIGHYFQPTPMLWNSLEGALKYMLVPLMGVLFIFLNIVEEVARLVSLSIRLYGNIFGEHEVKSNLLATMRGFLEQMGDGGIGVILGAGITALVLWASSFFVLVLGTLAGFIQAFIFSVLTLAYIAHAVADEH